MSCSKQLHTPGGFLGKSDQTKLPIPYTMKCGVCGLVPANLAFLSCGQRICNTCYSKCALCSRPVCTLYVDGGPDEGTLRTDGARERNEATMVTCSKERKASGSVRSVCKMCRHCHSDCEPSTNWPKFSATITGCNGCRHHEEPSPALVKATGRRERLLSTEQYFLNTDPKLSYDKDLLVLETGTPVEAIHCILKLCGSSVNDHSLNATGMASLKEVVMKNLCKRTHLYRQSRSAEKLIDDIASESRELRKELQKTLRKVMDFLKPYTDSQNPPQSSPPEVVLLKHVGESLNEMCTAAERLFSVTSLLGRDGNPGYGQTFGLSQKYSGQFQANYTMTTGPSQQQHSHVTWMKGHTTVLIDPFETALNAFIRHLGKAQKTYQWVVDRYLDSKIRTWAGGEYTCWSQSVHIGGYYLTPGATFYKGSLSGGRLVLRFVFKLQMELTDQELQWPYQQIKQVIIHPERPSENKEVQRICYDVPRTPPVKGPMYLQLPLNDSYCTADLESAGYIKNDRIVLRFQLLPT